MYMGSSDGSSNFKNSNFRDKSNSLNTKPRTILHCDGNSFFASCETISHPEYALVPMAVCGSVEDRHGIVLAKNELAKKYNIKTAETVWSAKRKCPELVIVRPSYGLYSEVSQKMNQIFYQYTDLVEPFGIDESWLDVSGSLKLFGNGKKIADTIRERVKKEIGITLSVGVSFNKVFAKLGSDLKKPDATSVISPENYKSLVWGLPLSCLLFAGSSVSNAFARIGVRTIGDLAACNPNTVMRCMGKNGLMLREFALGRDFSEVTPMGYEPEPKSVSNGMTFRANLITPREISFAATYLSMSVAERLRKHGLCCNSVAVTLRRPDQTTQSRTSPLSHPTCLWNDISQKALELINSNISLGEELYSLTIHGEKLSRNETAPSQQYFFPMPWEEEYQKHYSLETAVDSIRSRYGKNSIGIASALNNHLIG